MCVRIHTLYIQVSWDALSQQQQHVKFLVGLLKLKGSCWSLGGGAFLTHSKYLLYMGYIGQHPEVSGELPLGPQVGLGLVLSAGCQDGGVGCSLFSPSEGGPLPLGKLFYRQVNR